MPVGGPAGSSRPRAPEQTARLGAAREFAPSEQAALRRCVLAVSVLADVEVLPRDSGFVLPGLPDIGIDYRECADAIGDADPDSTTAHRRLQRWLLARRAVAERSLDELAENIRPVGLPVGHELHPGPRWARDSVLGGCLDVGIGFRGFETGDPDRVVVVPPGVLDAAGIDPGAWWRAATEYLENMGALATGRWRRQPTAPIRPMGDCDVVTLLASAVFRGALCADTGGMRAVAAPTRNRGWLDLSRIDPAFVEAAASIAAPEERGFARPVLLTVDEVALALPGGRPAEIVLRDAATDQPRWLRDVLYH